MIKSDVTVALLISVSVWSCGPGFEIARPAQPATSVDEEIRSVIELVNAQRRSVGCPVLQWVGAVAAVADAHSTDMVRRNFFSHTNPDGLGPFQRLERAGIRYTRAAENIAAGQPTGEQVFRSWLSSTGHRRNIEDCALRQHGIGFVRSEPALPFGTITNTWTHVLVTLR